MTDHDRKIHFLATIPTKAGAITIDGEDGGGGRVVFDVPGTDIAPLLKLTLLRGKRIRITAEPMD